MFDRPYRPGVISVAMVYARNSRRFAKHDQDKIQMALKLYPLYSLKVVLEIISHPQFLLDIHAFVYAKVSVDKWGVESEIFDRFSQPTFYSSCGPNKPQAKRYGLSVSSIDP